MLKESQRPRCTSHIGVVLAAGKANVRAPIEVNVERALYLRQNIGFDHKSEVTLNPEIVHCFQYGTGSDSGRCLHGICDSHHVT